MSGLFTCVTHVCTGRLWKTYVNIPTRAHATHIQTCMHTCTMAWCAHAHAQAHHTCSAHMPHTMHMHMHWVIDVIASLVTLILFVWCDWFGLFVVLVCLHLLIVWFIRCNIRVTDKRIKRNSLASQHLAKHWLHWICMFGVIDLIDLLCLIWMQAHNTFNMNIPQAHAHTPQCTCTNTDWLMWLLHWFDRFSCIGMIDLFDWFHLWIAWLICLLDWVIVLLDWFVCLIDWFICSFLLKSAASHFVI